MLKGKHRTFFSLLIAGAMLTTACEKSPSNGESDTKEELGPSAATISSFVAQAGDTEVTFSWIIPRNTVATGFLLSYRMDTTGPPWTHEALITQSTSFTLGPVTNGTPVYAIIQLIPPSGDPEAASPVAMATPTQEIGNQVYIPPSSFTMGWNPGLHDSDEEPAHEVWLDGYWIDRYPITVNQWKECEQMGACPLLTEQEGFIHPVGRTANLLTNELAGDHPMIGLDQEKARAVCAWREMQLPTEAQWEKAARGEGPALYPYPWGGETPGCEKAGFSIDGETCTEGTLPVGNHPTSVSPYGVHDMAGTVWQWTADWYASDAYSDHTPFNPEGPLQGSSHVLRGGAWDAPINTLFTTARKEGENAVAGQSIGARCVRTPL